MIKKAILTLMVYYDNAITRRRLTIKTEWFFYADAARTDAL
ncbi:hypothetical protein ACR6HW_15400 [Fusibacter sp. JL298sf-3]